VWKWLKKCSRLKLWTHAIQTNWLSTQKKASKTKTRRASTVWLGPTLLRLVTSLTSNLPALIKARWSSTWRISSSTKLSRTSTGTDIPWDSRILKANSISWPENLLTTEANMGSWGLLIALMCPMFFKQRGSRKKSRLTRTSKHCQEFSRCSSKQRKSRLTPINSRRLTQSPWLITKAYSSTTRSNHSTTIRWRGWASITSRSHKRRVYQPRKAWVLSKSRRWRGHWKQGNFWGTRRRVMARADTIQQPLNLSWSTTLLWLHATRRSISAHSSHSDQRNRQQKTSTNQTTATQRRILSLLNLKTFLRTPRSSRLSRTLCAQSTTSSGTHSLIRWWTKGGMPTLK